jgi:hypothetical protein
MAFAADAIEASSTVRSRLRSLLRPCERPSEMINGGRDLRYDAAEDVEKRYEFSVVARMSRNFQA